MINIKITAMMLCDLCGGKFTLEACEAICDFFEECGCAEPCSIGDICISFSEVPADWTDEYNEDNTIAVLDNGNVLITL